MYLHFTGPVWTFKQYHTIGMERIDVRHSLKRLPLFPFLSRLSHSFSLSPLAPRSKFPPFRPTHNRYCLVPVDKFRKFSKENSSKENLNEQRHWQSQFPLMVFKPTGRFVQPSLPALLNKCNVVRPCVPSWFDGDSKSGPSSFRVRITDTVYRQFSLPGRPCRLVITMDLWTLYDSFNV